MILPLYLAAISPLQADALEKADQAYCDSPASGQPTRYCLADRRYERELAKHAALLPKARRAAQEQRREIRRFAALNAGVTLAGDPAAVLEMAQKAWTASYRADCRAVGLSSATGNAGTGGVTADLECRADRLAERSLFLKSVYGLGD